MKSFFVTLTAVAFALALSSCASTKKSCCADGKGACCHQEVVCSK